MKRKEIISTVLVRSPEPMLLQIVKVREKGKPIRYYLQKKTPVKRNPEAVLKLKQRKVSQPLFLMRYE